MNDYNRIRILICDHLNLARGKYVPVHAVADPIRMCQGLYALGFDRQMIAAPGAGMLDGLPDIIAEFNQDKILPGWETGVGVVVADIMGGDKPLPLCARTALKRAIKQWQTIDLTPKAGIELEAFLFQRSDDGQWAPYDTPGAYVYGTGPTVDPSGIIDMIWQQSEACGFNLKAIHSEYDWPQFEFTLACSDALKAIDEAFLFRLMASEVCIKAGYKLSFMPKPLTDRGGSGFHINFSLMNSGNENAFFDNKKHDKLSDLSKACIAGLLHHHKGLAGLIAPTVNSYRRLRPASLACYWANWGYDHRGTMVRIPNERGKNTRIEYRLADCAANPYIATAATLQSAFLGYESNYPLAPAETGNCLDSTDTDQSVADTLGQALDDLEADKILAKAIGEEIVTHFLGIKRAEWHRFLESTTDWEFNEYINFL